jgi:hypothetical protein
MTPSYDMVHWSNERIQWNLVVLLSRNVRRK